MQAIVQICLLGFIAVCQAAPQNSPPIAILKQDSEGPNPDGSYRYSYETENGIKGEESGQLVPGAGEPALSVQGSNSYTAPDGSPIALTYTAGEQGYVPQGAHLPTPHPIPEAIQRALEYIAAHPPPPEGQPGAKRF